MPTSNPDGIKKFFNDELDAILNFYKGILPKLKTPDDKNRLVSQTYMSAATAWECFLSDIVIAYIEDSPETFFEHLKRSYEGGRVGKQKLIQEKYATLSFPQSISSDEIIELVDSEKRNITFSNAKDLNEKIRNWVSDDYLKKFNEITKEDKAIVNLIISLRNYIVHQSAGSFSKLEKDTRIGILKSLGLYNYKQRIPNYGEYLNFIYDRKTRFEIIIRQMKNLSKKL